MCWGLGPWVAPPWADRKMSTTKQGPASKHIVMPFSLCVLLLYGFSCLSGPALGGRVSLSPLGFARGRRDNKSGAGLAIYPYTAESQTHIPIFHAWLTYGYLIKWGRRRNLLCGRLGLLHKGVERCELSAPCLYLLLLSLRNILHDIGRFCKSFFRVFMQPCGGGVGSLSVAAGTLECWQTQKAGSGFLGLLSYCVHPTHDFEGGGFFWG